MKKKEIITFEESSGNVFADLGLDESEELLTRAKLGHSVRMILEKKKLKQREIGKLLDIKQPEVSNLMNGRYTLFSQERLFGFLNNLDRKITVQVTRRRKGESLQEVVLA
ncbi:MAG: XRE family transcriptional regulator [Nitrospinae bacterium CG22_combo_CG10-13_8_21_14_all_47_10]|nr:MAG: XRE family transcriptional regulator [Nitrospinae bacterium CG22_combo_CG10-13_8_21_14_all_47_10]